MRFFEDILKRVLLWAMITGILIMPVAAQQEDVSELSLEDMLNVEITSASKFKESVKDTPATMLIITRQDIERRGYTSLTQVFADVPGFDVIVAQGDAYQQVYARGNRTGSLNERTMFMVNGIEHNMLYTQHMQIDNDFPISSIERVEILFGPASAVYGPNAFSGVINVITRNPKDLDDKESKVFAQFGMGTNNTRYGDVTVLSRQGDVGVSLSYRRYMSDRINMSGRKGFFKEGDIIGNPKIWGPYATEFPEWNNATDSYAVLGRLTYKTFEAGYHKLSNRNGNGGVYPYDKAMASADWHFIREILYLKNSSDITDKLSWNFLTTYQKGGSAPDSAWGQGWNDGSTYDTQRTVELLSWKFLSEKWAVFNDLIYKVNDNWILSGGIKFAAGSYQKGYEFGNSDRVIFMPGDTEFIYNKLYPDIKPDYITPGNNFKDNEWGAYFQAKWLAPNDKFVLVLGARYDDNNVYGDTFNPRVGVVYKISKKLLIKANYGSAFQAPAPRNVGGSWGGLDVSAALKPDKIKTIDLSLVAHMKDFAHDVTLFRNEVTNSILQGENLPKKTMYGIEYKFNYFKKEVSDTISDLNLHFNYTFTDSKYEDPRSNTTTGRSSDKVGGIAKHKFNIIGGMTFSKTLLVNMKINYVGKRPTIVSNPIEEVDAYLIAGLSLQIKNLFKKVTLFLNVENIFDKDYYHPGYDSASAGEDTTKPSMGWYSSRLPQGGRTFVAGVRFDL